jgi:hypothetical protein
MLYGPTAIYHQWCPSGSQREQVEQSMPRRHEEGHITPAVLVETPYQRQKQLNTGGDAYHEPHLSALGSW